MVKQQSSRLKNKIYLDLLNEEFIDTIQIDTINKAMENIDNSRFKYKDQAKTLLTFLYYTGARPAEILELLGKDVTKEKNYIFLSLKTLKYGRPRKLALPIYKPFIKEAWNYSKQVFPTWFIFNNFRSKYIRRTTSKKGEPKTYHEVSAKLRYYFKLWFKDIEICPYLLRHNRFSIMSERGASDEDIKRAKGARTLASVEPYIHLSKKKAKSFTRFL